MKKVLPQIAFDFATDPEQELRATAADKVSSAPGVGVRVKSYKNAGTVPEPETRAPQLPLLMSEVGTSNVTENAIDADKPEAIILISGQKEVGDRPDADMADAELADLGHTDAEPAGAEVIEADTGEGDSTEGSETTVVAARAVKSKRGRKSLKQVSAEADLIEIPADEVLFRKQYYSMGEVAKMFRVNQSLLRFWETEFNILQPRKNKKGDRHFRPIDIKNLHLIYHLLRQRKYTIEGAKDFLKKNKRAEERFEAIQRLQQIRAFLLELKAQV